MRGGDHCHHYQLRAAAIVLLARATGMRLCEAILTDLRWGTDMSKPFDMELLLDGALS
jgi:hypothetical protein